MAATVIAAFSFSLVPGTAYAQSANDLKAKHIAYTGWAFGDGTIQTLDYLESVTLDKDHSVLRTERVRTIGAAYRHDTENRHDASTFSTGFTGNVFWRSDSSGFTVPIITPKWKKYALSNALIFSDALTALPWAVVGNDTVAGTPCTNVRIIQENALPIKVCVDATGAYKRVTIDPGGDQEAAFDVLAYTQVAPGKRIISKYHYLDSTATHTLTAMAANNVTPADLHPPEQTATWDFANSNPFPIKVAPSRIIVNATVNGVAGTFILDTGASTNFFSQEFADKINLTSEKSNEVSGIAGVMRVGSAHIKTIMIGGNTLRDSLVSFGGNPMDEAAPDGLLGFTILAGANVTLDVANQTMRIQPPGTFNLDDIQGIRLGVDLASGVPVVPMKLNGTIDIDATFDSGNPADVLISPELASKYGLKMLVDNTMIGYFSSHRMIGGVSGHFEVTQCGHIDEMELGVIKYQYVGACESPSFSGRAALVSLDFLRNFGAIDFDYPRSTMVLIPPKN